MYFQSLNLRLSNLYNDYCPDCGERHFNLNLNLNEDKSLFKSLIEAVKNAYTLLHKNKSYKVEDIQLYEELVAATTSIFNEAINKGIADNVIPGKMMSALKQDVFVFSALKTHAQLFEASRLLLDENGKVKSFNTFSQDVLKIKNNYNQLYLEAEYQFAVSSAQQAANWAKAEADGDRYNLQYRTAKDERVRESHASLDGITLPVSDAFWNEYYPPNGWRCRCKAIQVLKSKYETSDSLKSIEKGQEATSNLDKNGNNRLEIFRFNPGKQKVIFPPKHPYNKLQGVDYLKDLRYTSLILNKPLDKQYSSVYSGKKGGKVLVHQLADISAEDYNDIIDAAKLFADEGSLVRVLPIINADDVELRKKIFKGLTSEKSNPDLMVDNKYVDLKRIENTNKATHNANKAAKQGAIALISDKNVTLDDKMIRSITNRVFSKNNINKEGVHNYQMKEIYFIQEKRLIKIKEQ